MPHKSEAAEMLALAAGEIHLSRYPEKFEEKAAALLKSIVALDNDESFSRRGVHIYRSTSEAELSIDIVFEGVVMVQIEHANGGNFHIFQQDLKDPESKVSIASTVLIPFDPVHWEFVSGQPDTRIAPRPGEPLPQRPAAAMLLEAALDAARTVASSSKYS